MQTKLDTVLAVILTASAATMAAVLVARSIVDGENRSTTERDAPVYHPEWRNLIDDGVQIGAEGGPVYIIEFIDLECPFCRQFHTGTLQEARNAYPAAISLTMVHFPLRIHRFAQSAAVAAECAKEAGRFEQFVNTVLAKQDSFGLKSWSSFALEAEISEIEGYDTCVMRQDVGARVEAGRRLGERLGVSATPTVIINGWQLAAPPTPGELQSMIDRILDGDSPIDPNAL